MGKRRNSEVELCFDSMTDLITNLAGGLILLVLLLMGVTRDAAKKQEPKPKELTGAELQKEVEKSSRPLQDRMAQVQIEIASADREVNAFEKRLPQLQQEIDELVKKAKTPAKK